MQRQFRRLRIGITCANATPSPRHPSSEERCPIRSFNSGRWSTPLFCGKFVTPGVCASDGRREPQSLGTYSMLEVRGSGRVEFFRVANSFFILVKVQQHGSISCGYALKCRILSQRYHCGHGASALQLVKCCWWWGLGSCWALQLGFQLEVFLQTAEDWEEETEFGLWWWAWRCESSQAWAIFACWGWSDASLALREQGPCIGLSEGDCGGTMCGAARWGWEETTTAVTCGWPMCGRWVRGEWAGVAEGCACDGVGVERCGVWGWRSGYSRGRYQFGTGLLLPRQVQHGIAPPFHRILLVHDALSCEQTHLS